MSRKHNLESSSSEPDTEPEEIYRLKRPSRELLEKYKWATEDSAMQKNPASSPINTKLSNNDIILASESPQGRTSLIAAISSPTTRKRLFLSSSPSSREPFKQAINTESWANHSVMTPSSSPRVLVAETPSPARPVRNLVPFTYDNSKNRKLISPSLSNHEIGKPYPAHRSKKNRLVISDDSDTEAQLNFNASKPINSFSLKASVQETHQARKAVLSPSASQTSMIDASQASDSLLLSSTRKLDAFRFNSQPNRPSQNVYQLKRKNSSMLCSSEDESLPSLSALGNRNWTTKNENPLSEKVIIVDNSEHTTDEDQVSRIAQKKRRRLVKKSKLREDMNEKENQRPQDDISDDSCKIVSIKSDEKLAKLQEIFEDLPTSKLRDALNCAKGSIEVATDTLINEKHKMNVVLDSDEDDIMRPNSTNSSILKNRSGSRHALTKPRRPRVLASDEDSSRDDESCAGHMELRAVEFFNTAPVQDLLDITGCSAVQAELIPRLRPFKNLSDLKSQFTANKLNKVINSYLETMEGYAVVDQVVAKVEKIGNIVRKVLEVWAEENIGAEEKKEDDPTLGVVNKTAWKETDMKRYWKDPVYKKAMDVVLKSQPDCVPSGIVLQGYQILGISWLLLLWENHLSGILGDEMGLGKTAQVVVFLGRLLEMGENGPHLVIVSSSTLENWIREFKKFCPSLNVKTYYGKLEERYELQGELLDEHDYNVVVTTYDMAKDKFLRKIEFKSMILDEGHNIKNSQTQRYKYLMKLKIPFRLLLTGTPLQNNLQELMSLLIFIMPGMLLTAEEDLRKIFKIKVSGQDSSSISSAEATTAQKTAQLLSRERISRAKRIMAPFVLRRKKADVTKNLPPKIQLIEHCAMTDSQKALYDGLISETRKSYESDPDGKNAKSTKMCNILMQLRKAADHPLLFREIFTPEKISLMSKAIMKEEDYFDKNIDEIKEFMTAMSDFELHCLCQEYKRINSYALQKEEWMDAGKVVKLREILLQAKEKGDRVLLFSQFTMVLDILELVLRTLNITYCRMDGSTNVSERQAIIDGFNEGPTLDVFLLSTKAGGFGINLTSANVVILYDLDHNPHSDRQAEDRAHRVGQKRTVTVIKLISSGTVEEQILARCDVKLQLDQYVSAGVGNDDESIPGKDTKIIASLVKSALRL